MGDQPGPAGTGDPDHSAGDPAHDAQEERRRVEGRSTLLPEELAAGSDDPVDQAAALLRESDDRTEHPIPEEHRPSSA